MQRRLKWSRGLGEPGGLGRLGGPSFDVPSETWSEKLVNRRH